MTSPVRRTAIAVSNIEKSLRFYRDRLGLKVFYDQVIDAEATSRLLGVPNARVRIVSLQDGDSVIGMVGLLSFLSPPIKPREGIKKTIDQLDVFLLFMADDIDLEATHKRLKEAGTEILCPPLEYEVPQRGLISGFTCLDPDGISLAIMRFGSLQKEGGRIKASSIRRTSIVVSDLQSSLSFYKDILGLKIFYDQEIFSEGEGRMLGIPGAKVRIISLQGDNSVEGMVGLLSFISPLSRPREEVQKSISFPDVALILNTDEIETVYEKLKKGGAKIQCPPIEYEIPGRGICAGLSCYDPDGVLVEFTQFGPLKKK